MIYLDNAATTRPYDEVIECMNEVMTRAYANPSSVHSMGQRADSFVQDAKDVFAKGLNCLPKEIIFTSGATESDNLAILGYCLANKDKGNHIVIDSIEHDAVLNCADILMKHGFDVTIVDPDKGGYISAESIEDSLREDTILVSIMYVNNELGTIEPVEKIGKMLNEKGIAFHTDATQAFGKYDIDVKKIGCDLLSASSHKIHGPKGVGLLYKKENIKLSPITFGGGQQSGLRNGTINTFDIAGFARAFEIERENLEENEKRVSILYNRLKDKIVKGDIVENGDVKDHCPYILNVFVPDVRIDQILYALDMRGLCVSAGSACNAGSFDPTHVIKAIGKDKGGSSVRFSMSSLTTQAEIDEAADIFNAVIDKLRA